MLSVTVCVTGVICHGDVHWGNLGRNGWGGEVVSGQRGCMRWRASRPARNETSTHTLASVSRELFELAAGLGVVVSVRVDHEVVQMPEPPAEVLEALALLEVGCNLCAYWASVSGAECERGGRRYLSRCE